jgi:hypothetical protein
MSTPSFVAKFLTAWVLGGVTVAALAHGDVSCPAVPKEEKRPQMDLQRKLEAEGWKVRRVTNFQNCYEVYGFDSKGRRTEAFFNPRTFERILAEGEAPAN